MNLCEHNSCKHTKTHYVLKCRTQFLICDKCKKVLEEVKI